MRMRFVLSVIVGVGLAAAVFMVPRSGAHECQVYYNSRVHSFDGGMMACSGTGTGCQECVDSSSGDSCHEDQNGSTCPPEYVF